MRVNPKEGNNILTHFIKNRKWIFWALLIVGGFFFLNKRYTSVNGSFTPVDMIILLFWIGLLLMPFFKEIDFYGFKLKREIDELKLDINKQFIDLSRQFINLESNIKNSNNLNAPITNYVTIPSKSDDELDKSGKEFEKKVNARGIKPLSESKIKEVPDDIHYLFSVRYQIEVELKRIMKETINEWYYKDTVLYVTPETLKPKRMRMPEMVRILITYRIIDPSYADIILQVIGITNLAIHGEEISKGQINFVRETAPDLIAILKEITENNVS